MPVSLFDSPVSLFDSSASPFDSTVRPHDSTVAAFDLGALSPDASGNVVDTVGRVVQEWATPFRAAVRSSAFRFTPPRVLVARRDLAEPFVMLVLGSAYGNPVTAARGGVKLLAAFRSDPSLRQRKEALIDGIAARLPEGLVVSEASQATAQEIARSYVDPVRDLAACGDDAQTATRLAMDRGRSLLPLLDDTERKEVRDLLYAYLSAIRDDPTIVREVRAKLQALTLDEVRAIQAAIEAQGDTAGALAEAAEERAGLAAMLQRLIERWEDPQVLYSPAVDLDQIRDADDLGPSQLLNATYEVVPFWGRERELETFRQFREQAFEPNGIGVRVIEGEGGLGKTRLAMEAVRHARRDGWEAGFLVPGVAGDALRRGLRALDEAGRPVFVVADYGEDRPEQVAELLTAWLATPATHPRRLVLLVRQKGLMDQRLDTAVVQNTILGTAADYLTGARVQPLSISDLRVPPSERDEMFRVAQRSFAARLGRSLDGLRESPDTLTRVTPEYSHLGIPLYLHMAALASLDGPPTVRKRDLLRVVLDRNASYVLRLLNRDPILKSLHLTREDLHDVLTVATLALAARPSSADAPSAEACLTPTPLGQEATPRARRQLAAFLTDTFGAGDPRERQMDALRPDALGEGLVFETLSQTQGLLDTVLAMDNDSLQSACTVLVRAALALANDPEHWLMSHLSPEQLRSDVHLTRTLLFAIPDATVALGPLAALLAETIVRNVDPDDAKAKASRAFILDIFGIRLFAIGRRYEALAATEEAVQLYRQLAKVETDVFRPDLARCLTNLGKRLSGVGRLRDALTATNEAIQLYRRLAEGTPDVFEPDLALSLSNLGVQYSNASRHSDALAAEEEAITIRRRLVEGAPDVFEPELARSLSNLGNRLSAVGRRYEALAATEEAVQLYRRLTANSPDAFEPDLALSLSNLGIRLSDVSRLDEALVAEEEAITIRRRLAEGAPDAFEADLAASLTNLSVHYSNEGRHEDALAAAEESTEIQRRLAIQASDAFEPGLAASLSNLGADYLALGRRDDALSAEEEAVAIRRRLAKSEPDAFEADLAASLTNLGVHYSNDSRRDNALTVTVEAVTIRRRLAECAPDAFEPDLARSLSNLGDRQRETNDLTAAVMSYAESLRLLARFVQAHPEAFRGLTMATIRGYLAACETTNTEPDVALLLPLFAALGINPETGDSK